MYIKLFYRKQFSQQFIDLYNALKTRDIDRQRKSSNVREAAQRLRQGVLLFGGRERVTFYVHAAVHHLPDQVLNCPVDIVDSSGSAIEHVNKVVRTALRFAFIFYN